MKINPLKYLQLIVRRAHMRAHPTPAEEKAMQYLIELKQDFAFQRIVYPYIVDILIYPNTIVELDGDLHLTHDRYDDTRSYWLHKRGYDIYRLPNNDVTLSAMKAILKP